MEVVKIFDFRSVIVRDGAFSDFYYLYFDYIINPKAENFNPEFTRPVFD